MPLFPPSVATGALDLTDARKGELAARVRVRYRPSPTPLLPFVFGVSSHLPFVVKLFSPCSQTLVSPHLSPHLSQGGHQGQAHITLCQNRCPHPCPVISVPVLMSSRFRRVAAGRLCYRADLVNRPC